MRVLQVIHGYPMRYNAGSEVYTQTLSQALARRGHEVHVFTREEDPFRPDASPRTDRDADDPAVTLHVVNHARSRDGYRREAIDERFGDVLRGVRPDVVHVGHLNHLSTSLLQVAAACDVPIVFTLHDYWLMCPRGQFLQTFPADPAVVWSTCDGQEHRKCAERCYSHAFSGHEVSRERDLQHWTAWVGERMAHVREMASLVELFLAPSRYLLERFRNDFAIPASRLAYVPYGFDRSRLRGRSRRPGEPFTFGYIGTHIPAKGVHHLIEAFGRVEGPSRLQIWGRERGQETSALKALVQKLPEHVHTRVRWMSEYKNQDIVRDVFDGVDAVVVPSIWVENSPLVIHEALQAGVPVVTAAAGGMAELVRHEENGLLFRHREVGDLARQMQRLADDPDWARTLGARRYLASPDGDVPGIEDHAAAIEGYYRAVVRPRDSARVTMSPGPWRITFDTNPDDCNLHCIMCEEHSPHSPLQRLRRQQGRPPRRMDVALIERVLESSRGTGLREIIPSTMGEPLLYRDFERILDLCARYEVKLNLTTNGTFPRLGARAWAEKIVPVTSDTKISWNGATAGTHERIMLGTRWEEVVRNVRDFVGVRDEHARAGGNRCRVTFQLTFLEHNVEELPDIVRLAAELGVDRVKGHHLWAHFPEIRDLSMRRSPEAIGRWNQAVRGAQAAAERHRRADGTRVLLENLFELDAAGTDDIAPGGACPFLGQEAWVSAEGRFDPCCAPDAERRTLGDFGNLGDNSLGEIWNGAEYRDLVANYRHRKLCRGCNMRKPSEA
jgi:glycosyltransferase involved in cell wall biosynthesis/MoaA/NifB/PqqE/SkfB family radical SAM enzyme